MKRMMLLLLTLLLVSTALAESGTAQPAPLAEGDWYALLNGVPLRLSLNGDGTYERALPAAFGEPASGSWTREGDLIRLDDGSALSLYAGGVLVWAKGGVTFTREAQTAYAPAGALQAGEAALLSGYWKSAWADAGGAVVPSEALGDDTDLYIEGTTVALGGRRFGDIFWNFAFENGELIATLDDGASVALALQRDGFLCLTLDGPEGKTVLYLSQAEAGAPGEVAE